MPQKVKAKGTPGGDARAAQTQKDVLPETPGKADRRQQLLYVLLPWRHKPDEALPDSGRKLPGGLRLFIQACKMPVRHWELFGGILLIYAAFNLLLIGGLAGGGELNAVKAGLRDVFTGQLGQLSTGLALFGFLIIQGANTAATGIASAYQTMLLLLISLAVIWALRQVYAGHKVRIRDAFYSGMHPLVQYVLVMLFIGLQLIPAAFGGFLFALLVGGGILVQVYEVVIMSAIFFLLLLVSVYMLCSSAFALYIVTLPGMTPWKALQSAREIVRYRRARVLLRLLFLPFALLTVATIIMVPFTLLLTGLAPVVFFALSIVGVLVVHSYMYALYRELIA